MKLVHYSFFLLWALLFISCGSESEDPKTINLEISELTLSVNENPSNGQVLGTPEVVTDAEGLVFSIENEDPAGAVKIDAATGELSVLDKTKFDFEVNQKITLTGVVSKDDIIKKANILININDVDDAMLTTEDIAFELAENSVQNGDIIGTVPGSSDQGAVTFSFFSQSAEGALSINSTTGELSVADFTKFDFEANSAITAEVIVTFDQISKSSTVTINLTDVDDAEITAENFEASISENPAANEVIGTITANSDQEGLVFELVSQSIENAIAINGETGEITVNNVEAFDFEVNTLIEAVVKIANGTISENVTITISIEDVANPAISGALLNENETIYLISTKEFVITGENFGESIENVSITFNGDSGIDELQIIEVTPTQITAIKPQSDFISGTFSLTVRGESFDGEDLYYFANPISVNLSASTVVGAPGTTVSISGEFLTSGFPHNEGNRITMYSEGSETQTGVETISFTANEISFKVPKTSVNSTLVIENGVESYEIPFTVNHQPSFWEIISDIPVRGFGVKNTVCDNLVITNTSPRAEDNHIKLTNKLSGEVYNTIATNVQMYYQTTDNIFYYLYFDLPEDVGLYEIEVTVGDVTINGGYTVYANENSTMGYINGIYYDELNDEITVTGNPGLGIFGIVQTYYVQLLDVDTYEILYEGAVSSYSGGGTTVNSLYHTGFASSGLSGSFYVRVRRNIGGIDYYTPVSYNQLTIVF